jgi:FkbM family methyltransferase
MLRQLFPTSHWDYLSWYRDFFGAWPAIRSYPAFLYRSGQLVRVPTPSGDHVWLRPGTSDLAVYDEVFRHKEYELPVPTADYIINAGAHVGCASVWLSARYPDARILAIEPDPENFRLLQRQARTRPNITPIQAGLWSHSTKLAIANPTANTWSFQVTAASAEPGTLAAVTIGQLLGAYGFPRVDILKIDVEGAELEVFQTAHEWIDRVGTIVIELHDRSRPGCTEALRRAIGKREATMTMRGDTVIVEFKRT